MKLRELINEVYRDVGMSGAEIEKCETATRERSVALFGFDVGQKEVNPEEQDRLKDLITLAFVDPTVRKLCEERGKRFEAEHLIDGTKN